MAAEASLEVERSLLDLDLFLEWKIIIDALLFYEIVRSDLARNDSTVFWDPLPIFTSGMHRYS